MTFIIGLCKDFSLVFLLVSINQGCEVTDSANISLTSKGLFQAGDVVLNKCLYD